MLKKYLIKIVLLLFTLNALPNEPLRDPFFVAQKSKKTQHPTETLILQGVMKTKGKVGAIIKHGNSSELVFQNDKIGSYVVKKIEINDITLINGKKELKLFIE